MFKLVVLSALLAVVAAKPGYLHGGHLAYSAPIATAAVALPAATSHQYRTDIISKPVVATYAAAAPVVHAAPAVAYAAPAVAYAAAPVVHKSISYNTPSAAITHQSRVDLHTAAIAAPAVTYAHAAPAVTYAHAAPALAYAHAAPAVYGGW